MFRKLLLLFIVITSIATFAANTTPPANTTTAPAAVPETHLWNLHKVDIQTVIEEVSKITGKNFIIDPHVAGTISMVSSTPIADSDIYKIFLATLDTLGFSVVPVGNVIKIIPNSAAKEQAVIASSAQPHPVNDEALTRVIDVKHVPVDQLVPALAPLLPSWGYISAYGPSNSLIVAGNANNVARVAEVVHRVDVADNNNMIELIPLHYAFAEDIITAFQNLQNSNKAVNQFSIAADERSNAILISGSRGDRLRAHTIIAKLDTPQNNGMMGNTQIIRLRYLKAQDLAPVLAGVAQSYYNGPVGTIIGGTTTKKDYASENHTNEDANGTTPAASGTTSSNNSASQQNAVTQAISAFTDGDSKKPKVEIIAEPNTNSIIINAPPIVSKTLKRVIAKLDMQPEQILVEALIADVNENATQQLGIKWGTVASTATTGQGTDTSNIFQQGVGIISRGSSFSNIQGILNALANDQDADILSTPSVVVLDNHQAKILVGKQVSIQDSSYPNNAAGTTTASPYTTYTRENVALHLYVTPQIDQRHAIQLAIDQGNDSLENPENPSTLPVVNTSSIMTTVLVHDGDILVLGGLIQDQLANSNDRIPFLGDIPFLGQAFSHNSRSKAKKHLMIFLRPVILSDPTISHQVSNSRYNDERSQQIHWVHRRYKGDDIEEHVLPARN